MLFQRPDDDHLYQALIARDAALDGFVYAGVTTTGIFCRITCPARKPRRENVVFYDTVAQCFEAGLRPCKRCRPLARAGEADPLVGDLLARLEAEPERRWSETDVVRLGHDPSTVRRAFKRRFGLSFLEMARLRRVGQAVENLAGGASVIEAQQEAGFASGSGFRNAVTRLLGEAPAGMRRRPLLLADWIETPIGAMVAVADGHALHLLEFLERTALPAEIRKLQKATGSAIAMGRNAPIGQIAAELDAYFAGRSARFETRLAGHGTPFERDVWRALRKIPPGAARSYSQLAAELDRPDATRAVARANGTNQIAIVIPCHRVLAADGGLTGYGGGLWRKRWLLEHERVMFSGTGGHHEPE
ncbi:bifunctional transcriptional activator/DNA repair enzyme AdaA [Nitratireductor sp. ZSWI3]|uniref:bifunctional transcriptional activator/DNA repair enzyme AdaA n=1 Tax=Nitratireductor sp. ZSWI3 TaxID=2966359 RepID=UPI00214F7ECB|nr:trifunctional transcriptional activator/DNA repair protein Ada/methylated-DNA--[protein]-cysteine S-methyltransferase [Nitratireductor sp. ZSWI3]MCR4266189.1 trifunctional transcriptional activator/DNA repair protein Ada/methylated-DNA--[protein]-cysteine S-methyltransferase [Nitratireductor sp. ZSWI3]